MAIVVLDLVKFRGAYPEFASLGDAVLTSYFEQATLYLNNTDSSRVCNILHREVLLYLLMAHIALLSKRAAAMVTGGGGAASMTGAITSMTEGTVSIGAAAPALGAGTPLRAWLSGSPYGLMYLAAIRRYASFDVAYANAC